MPRGSAVFNVAGRLSVGRQRHTVAKHREFVPGIELLHTMLVELFAEARHIRASSDVERAPRQAQGMAKR